MLVGLLGLQGAFQDHLPHLRRCGAQVAIVRDLQGLRQIDRLILPGGESPVMAKFLKEFGMLGPLRERIGLGMPVWGICAGAILLARRVDGSPGILAALPMEVVRNAYGRQLASAQKRVVLDLFDEKAYPAIFIRAPRIVQADPQVRVHAMCDGDPVFVQQGTVMATTFHPELNRDDDRFHRHFLSLRGLAGPNTASLQNGYI
jgi:5'-phosphate synthase pdxT subunit